MKLKLKYLLIKYYLLTLFLPVMFLSCKKEAAKPPATTTPKTKTEMLTAGTWKYYEYFINYNQTNTILAYKDGKPNNMYDLTKSRLHYYIDKTYEETLETGTKVSGNWKFVENESKIELNINQRTVSIKLNYLDPYNFQWSTADGDTFARMVPM